MQGTIEVCWLLDECAFEIVVSKFCFVKSSKRAWISSILRTPVFRALNGFDPPPALCILGGFTTPSLAPSTGTAAHVTKGVIYLLLRPNIISAFDIRLNHSVDEEQVSVQSSFASLRLGVNPKGQEFLAPCSNGKCKRFQTRHID
jgi:hypothetical protein